MHRKDYKEEVGQFLDSVGPFKYFFNKYNDLFYKLTSFYIDNKLYEPQKADIKPIPTPEINSPKNRQQSTQQKTQKHVSTSSGNASADRNNLMDPNLKNIRIRNQHREKNSNVDKSTLCFSNNKQSNRSYYKYGSK